MTDAEWMQREQELRAELARERQEFVKAAHVAEGVGAALVLAEAELARERAVNGPCSVCCGKPLPSGAECICGGRGGYSDEMAGLRREIDNERQRAEDAERSYKIAEDRFQVQLQNTRRLDRELTDAEQELDAARALVRELRDALCRNSTIQEACALIADAYAYLQPSCVHDRLNEDGVCRTCGADRRGI